MNTIVAYPDNLSFSNGKYHHSSDNYKQTNTFSNLNEFDSLSQKDTLIYLVPSSIISSYVFENNQNLSKQNNLANFISDIDSFIVDDISKNEFFIFNENSFVINKTLYEELNTMLNTLNCKILVLPDYFLNRQFGKDTITEFNNKFLFSIKNGTNKYEVPRTIIFGGKAAPGYFMAKLMIRFINGIADVVNSDPDMDGLLRVVFLPDYNVKLGEIVYPATDLSEQISTAGKEASGTGNMKFAMNGALTVGTLDGANVELRDLVKKENFFLFGKTESEIMDLKNNHYSPKTFIDKCSELKEVMRLIEIGHFSNGDKELFKPLFNSLTGHDPFFVMADFEDYLIKQDEVSKSWNNKKSWNKMALLNTARSGYFSSDRSIREYCKSIWKVSPMPVEITCDVEELTN